MTPTPTSFSGSWGTSFTRNLTPDEETGHGEVDRAGFHPSAPHGDSENGAAIRPPVPWEWYNQLTDDDLKASFAYLQTIPPFKNRVPEELPPARR
jgi:hypothetical protein